METALGTSQSDIGGQELPDWLDFQSHNNINEPSKFKGKMNYTSMNVIKTTLSAFIPISDDTNDSGPVYSVTGFVRRCTIKYK